MKCETFLDFYLKQVKVVHCAHKQISILCISKIILQKH